MSFLLERDTVSGAEGSVVVTRNGKRETIAGLRNIRTNADIQNADMRVIGTRTIQEKPNGAKLTGSGNIYYGSNVWTDMVLEYINTGVMPEFDIQITNNDPATSVGSQTMAYYGCRLTGTIPLSILDNYDFNFTFTRVSRLGSFKAPAVLGN